MRFGGRFARVHKFAGEYIAEITKQRQRLRNNMSEPVFKTWHAKASVILAYIPEIVPLKKRFAEIEGSNESMVGKVGQARGILLAVVEIINSPLFGTGKVTTSLLPNLGGIVIAQNMTQMQTLTQSINVDLDTLLRRVDEVEGMSDEKKGEAKSLVENIWNYVRSGARDSAKFIDLTTRLLLLGFNAQAILNGLQF